MSVHGPLPLRAGPLTALYSNGDIRDVRLGETEVLRRIYPVFQDLNWTARPWLIDNERIDVGKEYFEIAYDLRGTFDAAPLSGSVAISGNAEGAIAFAIDLTAGASFWRNRLGLCVLHPMDVAGCTCRITSPAGDVIDSCFPVRISPHQPFVDIRAVSHLVDDATWATVHLDGETFEMEDHRNWSDASFKTYCTPISLPFPVEVRPGDRIVQSATLRVGDECETPEPWDDSTSIMLIDEVIPRPLIGLQVALEETPTTEQLGLLRALDLDHLRVDVDSSNPEARDLILAARAQADAIGSRLIVAVTVHEPIDLDRLADLSAVATLWLVFDAQAKVTGAATLASARAAFGPDVPIGGGTNLYFTELNREPPQADDIDAVAFSLNPQVHSSDDLTIVQNLQTQFEIALNAASLADGAPLIVGPVTLRPRFNPNATAPLHDVSSTPLPSNVDRRQMTTLGACWTAMSLKYLADAGTVSAITYFETIGWRGVMERAEGSPQPADFPSQPGATFPVYDILAAVAGFPYVRSCLATNPELVDALVLEDESGRRRLIVVNFTDETREVRLHGFSRDLIQLEPLSYAIVDERAAP